MTSVAPIVEPGHGPDDAERDMLSSLAGAINSDLDLRRVLQTVTDIATQVSGAQFGAFFYNGLDELGQLYQLHVLSGAGLETFEAMPAPRITALFEPTFTGRATIRIPDLFDREPAPGMPPGHLPVRSYLAVPVVTRTSEVIGALLFGHGQPHVFDARAERAVQIVAAQAAVAVENARLFAAEQAARVRAEEASGRLTLLQALTDRLAPALTMQDALCAVATTLGVPLDIARIGLFLRETDGFRAVASRDVRTQVFETIHQFYPDSASNPLLTATGDGRPVVYRDGPTLAAAYPEMAVGLPSIGASAAIPLLLGGRVLGALGLAWDGPRDIGAADVEMLVAAAGQLASTVERARLFDAERQARQRIVGSIEAATAASRALQRSLLPRSLPEVHGVDVAFRYRPSGSDVEVGGDWYDAVATDDGAVYVIGDVQGHSLTAAALMGQLRIAVHAYLAEGHPIQTAMARANTLVRELSPGLMATCCAIRVDTARGELTVASAGHPAPLLRRADGTVEEIAVAPGYPLGVAAGGAWPVTTVAVRSGARVLLYTDGLVERRGSDIDAGLELLRSELSNARSTDADQIADRLVDELGREPDDDIALLVCDLNAVGAGVRERRMTVGSDPAEIGEARVFTRTVLADWQLATIEQEATLIVSELVTNVVRHTTAGGTLELRRTGTMLRIRVIDGDSRLPRPAVEADESATGGRGMFLVEALSRAWGVEERPVGKAVWAEVDSTVAAS